MLVLSRTKASSIFIGSDICIHVLECDGHQVRLGIEAPREISIVRAELLKYVSDEVASNNKGSAPTSKSPVRRILSRLKSRIS